VATAALLRELGCNMGQLAGGGNEKTVEAPKVASSASEPTASAVSGPSVFKTGLSSKAAVAAARPPGLLSATGGGVASGPMGFGGFYPQPYQNVFQQSEWLRTGDVASCPVPSWSINASKSKAASKAVAQVAPPGFSQHATRAAAPTFGQQAWGLPSNRRFVFPPIWRAAAPTLVLPQDDNALSMAVTRLLKAGSFDEIPMCKLHELQWHLRYRMEAEAAELPPSFTAFYDAGRRGSPVVRKVVEEEDQDCRQANAIEAGVAGTGEAGVVDVGTTGARTSAAAAPAAGSDEAEVGATKTDESVEADEKAMGASDNMGSTTLEVDGVANLPLAALTPHRCQTKVEDGGAAQIGEDHSCQIRSVLATPAWRDGALSVAELLMRRRLEAAQVGEEVQLTLRQISYSQESIKGVFRDGRTIAQMRHELVEGTKTVNDIPKIAAVVHNGRVYSADNRRLWTFKHCGLPHDVRIPVIASSKNALFHRKLTTPTHGRTVRRRGDTGFC